MPENFFDDTTDRGIKYGRGDQTVPLSSADGIPSDKKIELPNSHNDLPTEAQCDVFKELSGKVDCEFVDTFDRVTSILTFGVFSPIDIQVVETNTGRRVGKDFDHPGQIFSEIDGAYYTGYDTDTEFLTIPNPEDGEYKILTQGTGDGEYKIEVSKISEDPTDPGKAIESTGIIEGTATVGLMEEKTATVEGNEVKTAPKDTIPPVITINIPAEDREYQNNQIIGIDFKVEDDQTSPEKIQAEIFLDEQKIMDKNIDLSLQNLGDHSIKIIAMDEAENQSEKIVQFKTTTNIYSIINNTNHYHTLGFIKTDREKQFLLKNLKITARAISMIDALSKTPAISPRLRNLLKKQLMRAVNAQIDFLVVHINKSASIINPAKNLLAESLSSLKFP